MAIAQSPLDRGAIPLPSTHLHEVRVLQVLDALLALHGPAVRNQDPVEVDVNVSGLRLHLRVSGHSITESLIELADDGGSALRAMRWRFGPDVELASMHRRVHRWLADGHEVLLDSFNGKRTCIRVA